MGAPEIFVLQLIFYLILWWWNDYMATVVSFIFGGIALAILLISLLIELVERSRVPGSYYRFMVLCIVSPLVAAGLYLLVRGGVSWL